MGLPFVDSGRSVHGHALYSGLLEQRLLLIRPRRLGLALWRLAEPARRNRERVAAGFLAYQQGDLAAMRRHFLQAILRNPFVLRNLGIVSLLLESVVGATAMARYRAWRHRSPRPAADAKM
jgi:hypothetical protein